MAKVTVYNNKGEKVKDLVLNPSIFEVKVNPAVVQQVFVAAQNNQRVNLAHTKDRSEVRGGGRKPWKQKGTGRARHGSTRSPIWIGGGVTFGPTKNANFSKDVNKKMRRKALFMVLSDKAVNKSLTVLDSLEVTAFSTKNILDLLKGLKLEKNVLIVGNKVDLKVKKSVANLKKVDVIKASDLNILSLLRFSNILLTEEAINEIEKTFLK